MENGAKALLIAGAILISVILMTVGIFVINTTSKSSEQMQTDMKTTSADVFNSKFAAYFGTQISGARVKTFLSLLMTNNEKSDHVVYVIGYNILHDNYTYHKSTPEEIMQIYNGITSMNTYSIHPTYTCNIYRNGGYDSQGYIGCITIEKE